MAHFGTEQKRVCSTPPGPGLDCCFAPQQSPPFQTRPWGRQQPPKTALPGSAKSPAQGPTEFSSMVIGDGCAAPWRSRASCMLQMLRGRM